jgi:plastocyanin
MPQVVPMTAPAISVSISREDCASMEVQVGTQVVWTNADTVTLPVRLEKVDDNGNSTLVIGSEIGPGDYFSTQLPNAGTYRFYCTEEKDKYGTINVK